MNTINDATSSPTIQPTATPLSKSSTGATNGAGSADTAGAAAGAGRTAAATTPTSSTVTSISTISTQLQAAQATTSSDAVFSTSKVNEIKQAIAEGRFEVNAENVAKGLLDGLSGLFGARQRS